MFKQISTVLLLLTFMAQTFNRTAIAGSYYVNRADFAKNCINKAKPKMHCNGKCQMMIKLKQEEKKDQQNPERRSLGKNEVLSSKSHFTSLNFLKTQCTFDFFDSIFLSPVDRTEDIFHPPGA